MSAADDFIHHMRAQDPAELKRLREEAWAAPVTARRGYDPNCPLARPHGHHWNGLGQGAETERECHGEPPATEEPEETTVTHPLPVGARVYHDAQEWARSLLGGTGEIREVKGPDHRGDYEYLVRTGHDLSRRPSPTNPETDERWWASYRTCLAVEETP